MANLNTAISPAPVVTVRTKSGAVATGYTGNVTVSLGENPSLATLGGTTTVAASAGVATFSNINLNRSGKGFTLVATAAEQGGYTPKAVTSSPFSLPTRCVFTTQPVGTTVDSIMDTFTVTVRDSAGNTDTNYAGEVTLLIYTRSGLGVLSGLTSRNAISGVANFSGISVDAEGSYSLLATAGTSTTAYTPAPVVSNPFSIGDLSIEFESSPSSALGFGQVLPTVATNALLNEDLDTSYIGPASIALGTKPTGATLAGTTTVNAVAGLAQFTGLTLTGSGAYTLIGSAPGYGSIESTSFEYNDYSVTIVYNGSNEYSVSVFSPNLIFSTNEAIVSLVTTVSAGPTYSTVLSIQGNHPQGSFTSITVNGVTLLSASASYSYSGGSNLSAWGWSSQLLDQAGAGTFSMNFA